MNKFAGALCAAFLLPAAAQADPFSLEVEAKGFYDSELVVEDVDLTNADGSVGFRIGADAEVTAVDSDALELEFGYDFGQTAYLDADQFDLQSHVGDVSLATTLGGAKLGLRGAYGHYRLDGEGLFDQFSLTPSVSGFIADGFYGRAFYTYADKDYDLRDERDSTGNQFGGSIFRFFSDNAGYFALNARIENEDAADPAFSFDGFVVGTRARLPLDGKRGGLRLELGAQYRDRSYEAITPSIGAIREEDRLRGQAELIVPLGKGLRVETGYRITDRNSNLPSADYLEHRVSGGIVWEL
ncbi:hypothetical protein [Sphingomicrobium astaxanthinifaciens]|uniref:hypothetical protein n=1 Tax=Sphingomicrobium astaxanthinifaciens TaxID=1227949 RepID=UPI001FCC9DB8|nr:hypothetical protein [Sphingomicrobium astaxanthinifaciens]MCJ7421263.1 hypothetical protein [Sphingomicrobium astaxanthinifaciens]